MGEKMTNRLNMKSNFLLVMLFMKSNFLLVMLFVLSIFQGVFLYLFVEYKTFTYLSLLAFTSFAFSALFIFYIKIKVRLWYIYNHLIAFAFIIIPPILAGLFATEGSLLISEFNRSIYSAIMVFVATLFLMVSANIQNFLEEQKSHTSETKHRSRLNLYKAISLLLAFIAILAYATPFLVMNNLNLVSTERSAKILFICSYLAITMYAHFAVMFQQDLEGVEDEIGGIRT